jgi:hypothetical protein
LEVEQLLKDNNDWFIIDVYDFQCKRIERLRIDVSKRILFINRIIKKYHDHPTYNKLIQNHKPVFLYREQFITSYITEIANKTKTLLNKCLGKIDIK